MFNSSISTRVIRGCEKRFYAQQLCNSLISCDRNWLPQSERISRGMPKREKMDNNASETETESISRRGTASGKPVAQSTRVKMYQCPSADGGLNGPAKSTAPLEKGSVMIGIDLSGTGGNLPLEDIL